MKNCPICDKPTKKPMLAALYHFRLVEWGQWQYWRGNITMFGFWDGLRASICLSFPFINTLVHWKYRKYRLEIK